MSESSSEPKPKETKPQQPPQPQQQQLQQVSQTKIKLPKEPEHEDNWSYTLLEDSSVRPNVYEAFVNLQKISRDFNTYLAPPEILVIGQSGHGKTSLIEALTGTPLCNGPTKRVTYFHLLNNPNHPQPKCTIRRDELNKDDQELPLSLLPNYLEQRQAQNTADVIHVVIEYANQWSVVLIDTPPISTGAEDSNTQLVKKLAASDRTIVSISQTKNWEEEKMTDFVKTIDPELNRTIFVYTHFYSWLEGKSGTYKKINAFLNQTSVECPSFFLTLSHAEAKDKVTGEAFKKNLHTRFEKDTQALTDLHFDKDKYKHKIGLYAFRAHLLRLTRFKYQQKFPNILRDLIAKVAVVKKNEVHIRNQCNSFSKNLRPLASSYATNFLLSVANLITGTTEGNTFQNGQTLEEEKDELGAEGEWVVYENNVFKVPLAKIPSHLHKIYGGQQFERLLFEFKYVLENTEISSVTSDDVAIAFGNQYGNLPWAAVNLARQKAKDAFTQAIEQVCFRATHIITRLGKIAETMMDEKSKQSAQKLKSDGILYDIENMEQYPNFRFHVKYLFGEYVKIIAEKCLEKCMEEFYSASALYWDITENSTALVDANLLDPVSDPKKIVSDLASLLFKELRKHIIKNTILRMYNFFLYPIQERLRIEVMEKVNSLSDKELNEYFEADATTQRYHLYISQLSTEIQKANAHETNIKDFSSTFSNAI
eukprot:TRINITY_DN3875_c0_g1_i2.p1 TRINITY_DN3875_c0_g1~~TRINITY_DN3875_c0_g1_i2.p1  ORF type:complete len:707 (-),score=191.30 TRINITY_DN3875_c0_g1_i2:121-2241(-)